MIWSRLLQAAVALKLMLPRQTWSVTLGVAFWKSAPGMCRFFSSGARDNEFAIRWLNNAEISQHSVASSQPENLAHSLALQSPVDADLSRVIALWVDLTEPCRQLLRKTAETLAGQLPTSQKAKPAHRIMEYKPS